MTSSAPTPPPAGPAGDLIYPPQPPKDPVIILVLNLLLFGCVGYFVMGQKMKGIAALVVWILGLASCGIVSGLLAVVTAIDGWMQAQQHQAGFPLGAWTFFKDHR
jgi:hypothetical protein